VNTGTLNALQLDQYPHSTPIGVTVSPAALIITQGMGTAAAAGGVVLSASRIIVTAGLGSMVITGGAVSVAAVVAISGVSLGAPNVAGGAGVSLSVGVSIDTIGVGAAAAAGAAVVAATSPIDTVGLGAAAAVGQVVIAATSSIDTVGLGAAAAAGAAVIAATSPIDTVGLGAVRVKGGISTQLRQAVYARLSAKQAITDLVGSRIYFGALPQSIKLDDGPALSYTVSTRTYGHTLRGGDGTSQGTVQISSYALEEKMADRIAYAVRDCWDGFRGFIGELEVTACVLENETDSPTPPLVSTDQWIYTIASDYQINHRRPAAVSSRKRRKG
jgi:hypothetical protein